MNRIIKGLIPGLFFMLAPVLTIQADLMIKDNVGHSGHDMNMGETAESTSPGHDHRQHMSMQAEPGTVGIDEKAGSIIPQDIMFQDARGRHLSFGNLIDKPTILLPVYYECPGVCGILMSSLAKVLRELPQKDRDTFRALTISFDPDDKHQSAAEARETYYNLLDADYPEDNWRFLTGTQNNIDRLLGSLGYRVVKQKKHLFQHPNAIIIVSADRKIIRYIYGTRFLPFDVGMALMEANQGTPGVSVKKILSYCFEYDPEQKRYTFQYIRIFGTIIPVLLLLFYLLFLRKGNLTKTNRKS